MRPLQVTAHLAGGVAFSGAWGIALDGLLAALQWEHDKADLIARGGYTTRVRDTADPADLDLPLARCVPATGPWHWAATCAFPVDPLPDVEVATWISAHDARALEEAGDSLPWSVSRSSGPYRTRHTPVLVTVCASLTWSAVGDAAVIERMLDGVQAIGKKRGSGYGHVLRWEVTEAADLDAHAAGHLHPDGTPGRPTPPACITAPLDPSAEVMGTAGIRPPYQHPSRQHLLVLPRSAA